MSDIGDFMWKTNAPLEEECPCVIHKVALIEKGWTPTDNASEEYRAVCGVFGQDWGMPAQHIKLTRTSNELISAPTDRIFCPICFPDLRGIEST